MTRGRRLLLLAAGLGLLAAAALALVWVERKKIGDAETAVAESTEIIDFEGYSLAVRDLGSGSPTVLIEAGLACDKDLYKRLHADLARKTRVLSYDHAGIGDSTPRDAPRTLPNYALELERLLKKKKLEPPYILLGHSLGGHIIRYFAEQHPDDIVGMVFIEHPHEDWFSHIRKTWSQEDQEKYFAWWTPEGSRYEGTALEELVAYEQNCDLVRGIYPPPEVPVLMFTGNAGRHYNPKAKDSDRKLWADMQASLLEDVREKRHIVDWDTGHVPHRQKPELFAEEIGAFIDEVRKRNGIDEGS